MKNCKTCFCKKTKMCSEKKENEEKCKYWFGWIDCDEELPPYNDTDHNYLVLRACGSKPLSEENQIVLLLSGSWVHNKHAMFPEEKVYWCENLPMPNNN